MNHAFRSMLLILVFASPVTWAQQGTGIPSFQLKVSPFRLIDPVNPGLEISMEKSYAIKHSTQLSVAYMDNFFNATDFKDYGGWRFSTEQKFFTAINEEIKQYLAAEFVYTKLDYQSSSSFVPLLPEDAPSYTAHFHVKKRNTTYNIKYGILVPLNRFVFDFSAGIGIKNRNVKRSGPNNNDQELTPKHPNFYHISNKESDRAFLNIPINIKVGYTF